MAALLVVLPICHKDWLLMADNLEWALQLDGGKVEYDALITHDTFIEPHAIKEVEKRARDYFRDVRLYCYDAPQEIEWPMPQNHAWQAAALHIAQNYSSPWFWWEADAIPLQAGWLDSLYTAYRAGDRPFAGHIVELMGHMNGVAVYPQSVPKYCPKALYCRAAPWDVMLKKDTIEFTTPLNPLIYHYPRYNGVKCQVQDIAVPERMKQLGYILFHGCNDGSLVKLLTKQDVYEYEPHPSVKVFGLSDVGRKVDESESLWFKEAIRLHKQGVKIADYQECRKPMPSLVEQAKANGWAAGIFDLPVAEGLGHFNSGFCQDDNGQFWLVTRRWERREKLEQSWHSTLQARRVVWDSVYGPLDGEKDFHIVPISGELDTPDVIDLKLSGDIFEEAEDPRVIFRDGRFYVSYCSWSQRSVYWARQVLAEFDTNWKHINSLKVPYGFNSFRPPNPDLKVAEKNWCWFWHNEAWHFVYATSPTHTVVEVQKKRTIEHKTENKLDWRYGEIRGGTPPVRIGSEYLSCFHSSLPWKRRQKRYYAGVYCFEAEAPFRITRISATPLLRGSEEDSRINKGPACVFPAGLVLDGDTLIMTSGINDEVSAWVRMPLADVLGQMVAV